MNDKPQFSVSYDGETCYTWRGQQWAVRHHAANTQREPDDRLVGCVYSDSCTNRHEFPPAELMAHFPGYVAAAYIPTGEKYPFEYTGGTLMVDRCTWQFRGTPRQETCRCYRLRAVAWREEMERHGIEVSS